MNTGKRGKKNRDIVEAIAPKWRENIKRCYEEKYSNEEAFAKAYKDRYGTGNATDVHRWLNAGLHDSKGEIGLPSYDTMKRLADFFGVTVGYLTGETDYQTFDMERACTYLGITKETGIAIRALTIGRGRWSDRIMGEDYAEILSYLLTSPSFKEFIHELQPVFHAKWAQQLHSKKTDTIDEAIKNIRPEILDTAMECMGYSYGDIPENAPEPTDELMNAIALLREAEDRALEKENRINMLDRDLRAAKYTLFEKYSQMIEEALCDKNVSSWDARREKETPTQKELMKLLNIKSSEQES